MSLTTKILRTVGAIGTGLVLYDAHQAGKSRSATAQRYSAGNYADEYIKSKMQNSDSTITSKLKSWWFNFNFSSSIPQFFAMIGGYVSGTIGHIVDSVVPMGLAIGTLALPKRAVPFCAAGLGLWAVKHLAYDVLDIGKPKIL